MHRRATILFPFFILVFFPAFCRAPHVKIYLKFENSYNNNNQHHHHFIIVIINFGCCTRVAWIIRSWINTENNIASLWANQRNLRLFRLDYLLCQTKRSHQKWLLFAVGALFNVRVCVRESACLCILWIELTRDVTIKRRKKTLYNCSFIETKHQIDDHFFVSFAIHRRVQFNIIGNVCHIYNLIAAFYYWFRCTSSYHNR